MKAIAIFFSLLLSFAVHAAEIKVATITSEFDDNMSNFYIDVKPDMEINSLRIVTKMPNGGIYEDITISAQQVLQDETVIVERLEQEAVRLSVKDFDLRNGGSVRLNYLYSGITGSRKFHNLKLIRKVNTFVLTDTEGKEVNKMFLVVNKVRVVGIVGIREIQLSFEAEVKNLIKIP